MTDRLTELREKRASIWEQMQDIMGRSRDAGEMSGEDETAYQRAEKDMEKVEADLDRAEAFAERAAKMEKVDRSELVADTTKHVEDVTDEKRYGSAFNAFLRSGMSDLDPEQRKILRSGYTTGSEERAGGVGTNSAGGYTVPPGFRNKIIEQIKTFGGMLQVAEILDTDSGQSLQWPTSDSTANVGAILAENTQVSELDEVFGTASLGAYKYTSKVTRISEELLQDSAFDVESWLSVRLGERVARILNQHFTTGTGSSQPQGIVTGIGVGKTGASGQTTTVLYDDLIDLIDSIDPGYQANAQFMLSQASRKAIRKLKDGDSRPLWQPSIQAGMPDLLLGYGYVINQDLAAPAASAKSILFGDFRQAYVIRQVRDFAVRRLDERYADYAQKAFLGFGRFDGLVQNAAAAKAYAHPAS